MISCSYSSAALAESTREGPQINAQNVIRYAKNPAKTSAASKQLPATVHRAKTDAASDCSCLGAFTILGNEVGAAVAFVVR